MQAQQRRNAAGVRNYLEHSGWHLKSFRIRGMALRNLFAFNSITLLYSGTFLLPFKVMLDNNIICDNSGTSAVCQPNVVRYVYQVGPHLMVMRGFRFWMEVISGAWLGCRKGPQN